jgi:hypothetical protein
MLRARSRARPAAQRRGDGRPGLRDRGVDLVAISTNEVFDGRRRWPRLRATDRPAPGNAYGTSKLDGERRAQAAFERAGATSASCAPRGCSAFRQRLPEPDPGGGRTSGHGRRTASRRQRGVGTPCTRSTWPTRSSTRRRCHRRDPPRGQRPFRDAGGLGALCRRAGPARCRGDRYPIVDVDASVDATALGRPRADALPSGEPLRIWPDASSDYAPSLLRVVRARA